MAWAIGRILPNTIVYSEKYKETTFRLLSGNDQHLIAIKGNFEVPLDCNNTYFVQGNCSYIPSLDTIKYSVDPTNSENFCIKNIEDPRKAAMNFIDSLRQIHQIV